MLTAQPKNTGVLYNNQSIATSVNLLHETMNATIETQWDTIVFFTGISIGNQRAQWREYRARNRERLNMKARDSMRKLRAQRKADA